MTHRSPDLPPEQRPEGAQRLACARFLSVLSLALFGIFAVTAATSALPTQLLQPDWQLRLGTSLIDNGPIAALALVAAWLAVILSPEPGRYEARVECAKPRTGGASEGDGGSAVPPNFKPPEIVVPASGSGSVRIDIDVR